MCRTSIRNDLPGGSGFRLYKKMKLLALVVVLSAFGISGCVDRNNTVTYDENMAYSCVVDEGGLQSYVTVYVDAKKPKYVTGLKIVVQDPEMLKDEEKSITALSEDAVVTQWNGDTLQSVAISFVNDKNTMKDHKELLEYLGLDDCWQNGLMPYEKFISDEDFRFANILRDGEVINNMSFGGEEKYTIEVGE